jgi:hypothetical protein
MRMLLVAVVVAVAACGVDGESGAKEPGSGGARLEKSWEPVTLAPGQEEPSLCASWTLDNTETLYVHAVEMTSGFGWHHSNWFFVPAGEIAVGPDGIWPCEERRFDQIEAGFVGGVLFAQSTGATHEVQQFQPGAAIAVPPGTRVVGQLHLLNATDAPLTTSVRLEAQTLASSDVTIELAPLALQFLPLSIPPRARSRFATTCEMAPDFKVYYVLPHYHGLGVGMTVESVRGDQGDVVFRSGAATGEPLGRVLDPPFDMTGAAGLRFSCTYDNPTDRTVRYGNGDGEMCVLLAYTDDRARWGGGALLGQPKQVGVDADGTLLFEAGCGILDVALD